MEKRITKIYFFLIVMGIITFIYGALGIKTMIYAQYEDSAVELIDDVEEEKIGDSTVYTIRIPEKNVVSKILAFESTHVQVTVNIDGETIYKLKQDEESIFKTTGHVWNIINLRREYEGKKIEIVVDPVFSAAKVNCEFLYGVQTEVEKEIVSENGTHLFLAILILIIGLALFSYSAFIVEKERGDAALQHFATFTLLLGLWAVGESTICDLLIPWHVSMNIVSHFTLMIMPIPFMLYLKGMFQDKENIIWYGYCYLNVGVVIIRIVLQVLGLFDLKETLWLTHISIGIFVVIIICISVKEFLTTRITRQMKLNIFCIIIIMISTIVDVIMYRITGSASSYGIFGFLFYVIVMGIDAIKKSRRMLERARESEVYRKLAYTDELTGLYNRTAFRRDMENQTKVDKETGETTIMPTVIFMFDLNDLKKCNDNYGHEYGDQYISMASSIISQVFGLEGRCYRIGGDEFCVMMPYVADNEVENKLDLFRRRINDCNRKPFVVKVNVAVGYAVYNPQIDQSLEDTRNRADELMYKNKEEQKQSHR